MRRLIAAADGYTKIVNTIEAMKQSGISYGTAIYTVISAGIGVTYARPFRRADDLGPLPTEYAHFPDSQHKATHDSIILGRDLAFAHASHKQARKMLKFSPEHSVIHGRIKFTKRSDVTWLFSCGDIALLPEMLERIDALCRFQVKRLTADAIGLLKNLGLGQPIVTDRTYVLGEDYL